MTALVGAPAAQKSRPSARPAAPAARVPGSAGPPAQEGAGGTEERAFAAEEIFFSTTDRKGIIRSGNRVFTRVSAYAREEMIGKPHNLIRHPDMPRAVFRVLWEEIGAGRPIAAYVKNRAKDGNYYWVMATIVPCQGGYLSVRIKPCSPYFEMVQGAYRVVQALEREVENGDVHRREQSIQAGKARLMELLKGAGFADYDAFMHTSLLAEVKHRETLVGKEVRRRLVAIPASADPTLRAVLCSCAKIGTFLDGLVAKLDTYVALNEQLADKARFVLTLAEEVRRFSLNAQFASTRVNGDGVTLGAVAALMQSQSAKSGPVFRALAEEVAAAIAVLGGMFFPVAATKLQAEQVMVFVHELLDGDDGSRASADDLGALARCLVDGVERLSTSLAELEQRMRTLGQHVRTLKDNLERLRALEINGRIEAARIDETDAVLTLFQTIGERITAARQELNALADASRFSFGKDAAEARRNREHVATIGAHLSQLGCA